jgi:hypothetical protein
MMIVGLVVGFGGAEIVVVLLLLDLLKTVEVFVVGAAVTVWVFCEEDEGGGLLVVGS